MKAHILILAAAAVTFMTCNPTNITPNNGNGNTNGEKPANHAIVALNLEQQEQDLIAPTNEFILQTFKEIASAGAENTFVSPLSAAFVLSMLANGAEGNTLAELQAGLGYENISLDAQNTYFHKLITALPYQDSTTIVELANALFIDEDFPIYEEFKATNEQAYLAEIENLPMRANSDAAAATINAWAAQKTHNCIPEIVTPQQVQSAIMAVCNAIYFKGYWKEKFDKDFTFDEMFYSAKGNKKTAFLHQTENHAYAENDICQYVSLPYEGNGYSMDVILPREGINIDEFRQNFTLDQLAELRNNARYYYDVQLSFPKFKVEYNTDLIPAMNALGIKEAFTGKANFNNISEFDTYIQAFFQKAYVCVDEEGTEAAAVTVGTVGCTSVGPGDTVIFNANRPFLYMIRENKTGLILFIGQMDMPK